MLKKKRERERERAQLLGKRWKSEPTLSTGLCSNCKEGQTAGGDKRTSRRPER